MTQMASESKKGFGQMAGALQRAGIVRAQADKAKADAEKLRAKTIADVRAWLVRLVEGEVVTSTEMTTTRPHSSRWKIANRFVQRGMLQVVLRGQGSTPTEQGYKTTLKLLNETRISTIDSNAWLASFVWPWEADGDAQQDVPKNTAEAILGVEEPEPSEGAKQARIEPKQLTPRDRILADVQVWLARLRAGETVGAVHMTEVITDRHYKQDFAANLRREGLVETVAGRYGGAKALPALIELGVPSDEWIIERLAAARASFEESDVVEQADEDRDVPEWHPDLRVPKNSAAREAKAVKDVRAWLKQAARGGSMRAGHLSSCVHEAKRHRIAAKLVEDEILVKRGTQGNVWYEATSPEVELTDEQIASLLWPERAAMPEEVSQETTDFDIDLAVAALGNSSAGPQDEALALVAERWGQILTVLERMDARFARLERELALPPIEQEPRSAQEEPK
jgi:hypothetical protein